MLTGESFLGRIAGSDQLCASMFIEIEETVRFLSAFMYGKIPRSRVKAFCAHLTNLLSEVLIERRCQDRYDLIVFADGRSDDAIVQAARRAYVHLEELQECMNTGLIMEIMSGRVRALTPSSAQLVYPKATQMDL